MAAATRRRIVVAGSELLHASHVRDWESLTIRAVADRAGAKVVFVVESGKLRMTPIKAGAAVGNGLELLEGPEPGTKLVSNPARDLTDGREVKEKGNE